MNLKKFGKVFTSKFVGTGPSSYKKRIYRAAVLQRLRNTGVNHTSFILAICYMTVTHARAGCLRRAVYSVLVSIGHPSAIRAREEHHVVFTLRPYTSRFSVSATKTQVYGIIRNIWLVNSLAGAGNRAVESRYFFSIQLLDLILFTFSSYCCCVCPNIFFFFGSLFSSFVSSKLYHPPTQLLFLPSSPLTLDRER